MRKFIEAIRVIGIRGIISWFKRLLVAITLLEFISYGVFWLVTVGAMSKLVLIWIPVIAVIVTALDDLIKEKEDICEEDEEIEEEEEEEEEIA